jgi:hypothetical protein
MEINGLTVDVRRNGSATSTEVVEVLLQLGSQVRSQGNQPASAHLLQEDPSRPPRCDGAQPRSVLQDLNEPVSVARLRPDRGATGHRPQHSAHRLPSRIRGDVRRLGHRFHQGLRVRNGPIIPPWEAFSTEMTPNRLSLGEGTLPTRPATRSDRDETRRDLGRTVPSPGIDRGHQLLASPVTGDHPGQFCNARKCSFQELIRPTGQKPKSSQKILAGDGYRGLMKSGYIDTN